MLELLNSGDLHDCDIFPVARNSGVERKDLPTRSIFPFVARCKSEKMDYLFFICPHSKCVNLKVLSSWWAAEFFTSGVSFCSSFMKKMLRIGF